MMTAPHASQIRTSLDEGKPIVVNFVLWRGSNQVRHTLQIYPYTLGAKRFHHKKCLRSAHHQRKFRLTPETSMSDSPSQTRVSASLGQAKGTFDLYSEITRQITDMLDKGVVPWRSPILGQSKGGYPKNLDSKKPYRGVNVFLLAFTAFAKGYGSAYWLTFNQAIAAGGSVKRGEKSSMVVFWKKYEVEDKQTGEKKDALVARYYRVFNCEQCDGIKPPDAVEFVPTDFKPIEEAEKIVKGYADGPAVEYGGTQAFYRPSTDTVQMPDATRFVSPDEFYGTVFHELSHSTGAKKRLDRGLGETLMPFGSADYGKEELVAEMSAAYLCGHARIMPAVIQNQAAYISGWLGRLKEDKKLIIQAAAAGQRAADWIRGQRTWDANETPASQPPDVGKADQEPLQG